MPLLCNIIKTKNWKAFKINLKARPFHKSQQTVFDRNQTCTRWIISPKVTQNWCKITWINSMKHSPLVKSCFFYVLNSTTTEVTLWRCPKLITWPVNDSKFSIRVKSKIWITFIPQQPHLSYRYSKVFNNKFRWKSC